MNGLVKLASIQINTIYILPFLIEYYLEEYTPIEIGDLLNEAKIKVNTDTNLLVLEWIGVEEALYFNNTEFIQINHSNLN